MSTLFVFQNKKILFCFVKSTINFIDKRCALRYIIMVIKDAMKGINPGSPVSERSRAGERLYGNSDVSPPSRF